MMILSAVDAMNESGMDRTEQVAEGARSGRKELLEELYRRVAPTVSAWAYLRTSPQIRRRIDPQDILQEVWFRVIRRLPDYDPRTTPFRPWVFKIARFVLIEMIRKLPVLQSDRGTGGESTESRWSGLSELVDSATGVGTRVARNDAVERFLDRVEVLGGPDRDLVRLRALEGQSLKDIAERLDLSPDVVAKRWQRLCARLSLQGPRDLI